jgi:hypothetical protein
MAQNAGAPWWEWLISPAAAAGQNAESDASNWASDIGGKLASGIEVGFVAVMKDIWKVIEGPFYILIGLIIINLILLWYFREDINRSVAMLLRAVV